MQSCVVVTKASAFVGLGSKSSRQLDAKHAVFGMDASPSHIDIYLVALYPKPEKAKCWCQVTEQWFLGLVENNIDVLDSLDFFSNFYNLTFRFSPTAKSKTRISQILRIFFSPTFINPCFQYSLIFEIQVFDIHYK